MTMIPKIRFSEFEEEWKKVKLYNYATRITRKNTKLESNLPLTISSIDGLVSQIDYFNNRVASQNISGYYLIKNGEYAYNKSYSNGYPWGSVKRLDKYDMGVLSTLYIVFSINDSIDSDYFSHFFDTNLWHREVATKAEEGARNHGLLNISVEDFFDINISTPTLSEQRRISHFFTLLDETIRLEGERLLSLKQVKAASLQSFFPQEGEKEPRVRFKGFSGEWKKVRLGEIEIESGSVLNSKDFIPGNIPVIAGGMKPAGYHKYSNREGNVITISASGANAGFVSYYETPIFASDCSTISEQKDIDTKFLFYAITLHQKEIFKCQAGGAQPHVHAKDIKDIKIVLPTLAEQCALSTYFTNIDEQIRLVSEKIEKMKKVKGACLEGMMV